MGLSFSACTPSQIFDEPFASTLVKTLRDHYGEVLGFESEFERYSEEVGWSGWKKLQERGLKLCGKHALPHFLSMEAWHGCYLPIDTDIGGFSFADGSPDLRIASLDALVEELQLIGGASELPMDDKSLAELFAKYIDDDDLVDQDMDIQTFTQALPVARFAQQHRLVFWVIK